MSTSVNAQQIPIDMLLLDKDNYRLDGATDQHSVLANLIDDQGEKLIKLAEHILFNSKLLTQLVETLGLSTH